MFMAQRVKTWAHFTHTLKRCRMAFTHTYNHSVKAVYPAMRQADKISLLSQCDRAKVGCVFVATSGDILVASNNHSHGGMKSGHSCITTGHELIDQHCCATTHAEIACIVAAMKNAISLEDCVCVVTHTPCVSCSIALIEVGIKLLYIKSRYKEVPQTYQWFMKKGIRVFDWNFNLLEW